MFPFSTTTTRGLAAGATVLAVFAAAVSCSRDSDPDYQGVCIDQSTGQRSDDRDCKDTQHHGFFFFPVGLRFPAVGQSVAGFQGGTTTLPDGHTGVLGGAAAAGGVATKADMKSAVTRGGFGTRSQGSGTGG